MKHIALLSSIFVTALVACAGCRTERPPVTAAPDAGSSAVVDAGTSSTTSSTGASDAGVSAPRNVFDRILAKPKDASMTAEDIKALVEKTCGAPVAGVRRTAVGWILITLSPTTEGRTEADQRKVIDVLTAAGIFEKVEADRLMKVR